MNTSIEIVPYNPAWPLYFAAESASIQTALGENCITIHHVGSTSIPGMRAKPIIDMIPVVKDIVNVDNANAAMMKLGYEVKGEAGMLFRRFFTKSTQDLSCNVHVYEADAGEVDRLIKFRDWLRTHQNDAEEYARLKSELAVLHINERLRYTMGKENFIVSIDNKTGYAGNRIVKVLTDREWQAYHRIRKEQIFDLMGVIYNTDHFTYKDQAYVNLVLYHGSEIVGVAQLQYLDADVVALRPFAIDAPYQNQGLGSIFLKNIERWLRQQGKKLIRLHANPPAVKFYEQHGYTRMPFPEPERTQNIECVDMGKQIF